MVLALVAASAAFLLLAWALGLFTRSYLAGGAAFGLTLVVGESAWPWFRIRRARRRVF
jgi:hypothetical protein